jgi:PhoH-like ATPase
VGKAGTGKTLLALAAAMRCTIGCSQYSRILITRPIMPLGRDLGFLPGSMEEKMNPWLQPIFDNLEMILNSWKKKIPLSKFIDDGVIQIEPLTYIRGRSLPRQYLIVDEAQNLTPHEVKTIITRSGQGTKVVLTGDPYQIDNPYVDRTSNGLIVVTNKFKEKEIFGHVRLVKGERSELAELASNLL